MDFYIDIGFAVLLRLLKNAKERDKYRSAFLKVVRAAIVAFNFKAADLGFLPMDEEL